MAMTYRMPTPAQRLRFSLMEDMQILKLVVLYNPYSDRTKWQNVQQEMVQLTGKPFTHRNVKEHIDHLLRSFCNKSIPEEEYTERDKLVSAVFDLRTAINPLAFVKTPKIETPEPIVYIQEQTASPSSEQDALENIIIITKENPAKRQKLSEPNQTKIPQIQETELKQTELNLMKRKILLEERQLAFEQRQLDFEREKFIADREEKQMKRELLQGFFTAFEKQQQMLIKFVKSLDESSVQSD